MKESYLSFGQIACKVFTCAVLSWDRRSAGNLGLILLHPTFLEICVTVFSNSCMILKINMLLVYISVKEIYKAYICL